MRIRSNQKGFTILEVLIGVAILSAMSIMMYSISNRTLESKVRVERRDELLHGVRIGMQKMSEDIAQAFITAKKTTGGDVEFATGMEGVADKLDFSTMAHHHIQENAKDTDHVSVGYSLKRSENGVYNLMRRESFRLTEKVTEGGKTFTLMEGVKDLKFEYYDSNKKEWVSQWDTSSISSLSRLPQAIKITVTVVPEVEEGESVSRENEVTFSTIATVGLYKNDINL